MAERKLIYADTAVEKLAEMLLMDEHEKKVVQSYVEKCMAVDAEPVVRCGKCKWYDPEGEFCKHWNGVRHPEHYCGDGERKKDFFFVPYRRGRP
jgi:hypothetical protein